jgi:UDP-N-acetylmuramoyl-tripeptide--D-alanyl-D-alanine ligase
MLFTLNWLQSIFPKTRGEIAGQTEIKRIMTDSRIETSDALFVPLVGEQFDGHDFVLQAYENGITAVLWEEQKPIPAELPMEFPIFLVEDTTKALQHLSSCYRDEINPIVIGVTGSNGKTTTKDIISSITKEKYKTHFTNGNFNNEFGVPFTILSMSRDTEVLVLEMGMSSFGEIELLSTIAKPDYAVITNIGESHIEYLGSREGIAKAKLEITSGLKATGKLIIDGDEELLSHVHSHTNVKTVGFGAENDFMIKDIKLDHHQTTFSASDGETYTVSLLGKHNAKNAAYGIVLGKLLNISTEQIKAALSSLTVTGMRFEMLTGESGVSIINDAYNASPTSMKAAIQVVKEMSGFQHKVLVLGDIYELGEDSRALHQTIAEVIDDTPSAVFTVGEDSSVIAEAVQNRYPSLLVKHFQQKEDVLPELNPFLNKDSLILFKASRGMKLESIIEQIK